MNLKQIDYKQFFLRSGHWVGLGVVLPIALLVIGCGVSKALSSGSAARNAKDLKDEADRITNRINSTSNVPPPEIKQTPEEVMLSSKYDRVDPDPFVVSDNTFFVSSTIEDTKRHMPEVLVPSEFHVDLVLAGVPGYKFQKLEDKYKVAILEQYTTSTPKRKRQDKRFLQGRENAFGTQNIPMMGMMTQMMGARGPNAGSMMPGGNKGGPGGSGVNPQMPLGRGVKLATGIRYEDVDKVENKVKAKWNYPERMAIVTATFPYEQQLQQFRKALRKSSLNDMVAMIQSGDAVVQFKGLTIERREIGPDGKVRKDWERYDEQMLTRLTALLGLAEETEPEDQTLREWGLIKPGLVYVRPRLASITSDEHGRPYPKPELEGINKSLEALRTVYKAPDEKPKSPFELRFSGQSINALDPDNPQAAEPEEQPKPPPADTKPQAEGEKKQAAAPEGPSEPDKVLVRFIDLTVQPGRTYEYRVKVRMANPNYGKKNLSNSSIGKPKEIESTNWSDVVRVQVPYETQYYVTDDRPDKDKAYVQIHKWVDSAFLTDKPEPPPDSPEIWVGDWTYADRIPAYRGEYLGKREPAEVPYYVTEKQDYELAAPKTRGSKKLPLDFTVRKEGNLPPELLIDYDGGKGTRVKIGDKAVTEDLAVDMLVLTPDGKLIVRNSVDDMDNKVRGDRVKDLKAAVEEIKKPRAPGGPNGPGGKSGPGTLFDRSNSPLPGSR
jgi:hypothetical protein